MKLKEIKLGEWKLPGNLDLKHLKKDQILIILLAGILLLIIAIPAGNKEEKKSGGYSGTESEASASGSATEQEYVAYLESHLEEMFSQIEGAGDVRVMITLNSSAEKVVEKDVEKQSETVTEEDSQGGERTTSNSSSGEATVYGGGDSDTGAPYVSKEITPKVEGVIVIADGGDNALVTKNITEAVQALFGIDTHKIRIMKKK